jgi:hypothetical protein
MNTQCSHQNIVKSKYYKKAVQNGSIKPAQYFNVEYSYGSFKVSLLRVAGRGATLKEAFITAINALNRLEK